MRSTKGKARKVHQLDKVKSRKNRKANAVIILCVIVIIACALGLMKYFSKYYRAEKNFTRLQTSERDLKALHRKNHDLIGWIKIDKTKINYPVMWTPKSPEFYLRRDFKKKYSIAGTPFLDANSEVGKSANYLIYGHNIRSGTMFHCLPRYSKPAFYKEHRIIHFETLKEGKRDYKVIAAFKTETYTFRYYDYASIKNEKQFRKYIKGIKKENELGTNSKLDELEFGKNQLISLSTCSYHVSNHEGRYVVVAEYENEPSN